MSVAVEGALEDGNGGEAAAAQVDVGGEGYGEALGPGIAGAVLGEGEKVLPVVDDQVGGGSQSGEDLAG